MREPAVNKEPAANGVSPGYWKMPLHLPAGRVSR